MAEFGNVEKWMIEKLITKIMRDLRKRRETLKN
jgi:hypothetical protein